MNTCGSALNRDSNIRLLALSLAVSRGKVQDAQFAFHMGDVFDDLVRLFFANGEVVAC